MAENRRGKENRFYFSRGQMVLLGAAFTLSSLIIFFLGIFVGKGIEERMSVKKEEPLVKIPVKPSAQDASTAAAPRDEIAFNDALPSAGGAEASADEKPKDVKPVESAALVAAKEKGTAPRPSVLPPKAVEKNVDKATPSQDASKKLEPINPEPQDAAKSWRAQVNAYPDERSAKLIVDRLKNKGYNAYFNEVQNNGKTWYRVSVGKYASRNEAEKVLASLQGKENFPKAFVTSK
jgi:cell division septation protein DedD